MSPVGSTTQTSSTTTQTDSTQNSATDPLANEETFLKLLVSQLQNQDPMNPTDSNQFVSQLTSYSQLEQMIGVHSDTTSLVSDLSGSTTSSSSSSGSTNSGGTNSTTGN